MIQDKHTGLRRANGIGSRESCERRARSSVLDRTGVLLAKEVINEGVCVLERRSHLFNKSGEVRLLGLLVAEVALFSRPKLVLARSQSTFPYLFR